MQNSKLIDLLKTFEKEDWRWFRKFLLSPYFNSREELVIFCDYLRVQAPDFKEKTIRKEKVFKKLYPSEIYDEKKISYAMNFLLGQAERFLAQREIELQPPLVNISLQKSLVKRQLEKHYNYQYDKSKESFEERKKENIDYYLLQYQKSEIANVHYNNKNLRNYDPNLQATSDELDQFYLIHKLKYCCEMVSRSKLMNASYEPMLESEIINFLTNITTHKAPLISVYLETYFILKKENAESNFENLKKLLIDYSDLIPPIEKAIIYQYGINYCIFQIGKNNNLRYYAEQSLKLYLDGIEQRILFNQGYLSPWHFKNVIKLGLNLKKYDFIEEFIQKHHKNLEEEYQEDALHFNLADLNYRKKNYGEAQIHLLQVQYSDIAYSLGAKEMLLRIYYEINEGEALFALIASFSIYLRRNKKITKETREAYLNFTNILGRIVRATKYKYPAIIEKINETKRLYNRNWLLEICQGR